MQEPPQPNCRKGFDYEKHDVDTKYRRSVKGPADTKSHKILLLVIVCVLALMISPAMHGQATGSFSGMSSINPERLSPEPTLSRPLREPAWRETAKTDSAGHYLIPLLPVGTYTVRVDATGFQSAESKDLHLQVDEARELDFRSCPRPS